MIKDLHYPTVVSCCRLIILSISPCWWVWFHSYGTVLPKCKLLLGAGSSKVCYTDMDGHRPHTHEVESTSTTKREKRKFELEQSNQSTGYSRNDVSIYGNKPERYLNWSSQFSRAVATATDGTWIDCWVQRIKSTKNHKLA